MNLAERREGKRRGEEKNQRERRKTNVKSTPHSHAEKDSSQGTTKTKQFCMT